MFYAYFYSVKWNFAVDFTGPGVDAAGKVEGVEAGLAQVVDRMSGTHPVVAHHHQRQLFGELGQTPGQLRERDEDGPLDSGRFVFLVLTDVEQEMRRFVAAPDGVFVDGYTAILVNSAP